MRVSQHTAKASTKALLSAFAVRLVCGADVGVYRGRCGLLFYISVHYVMHRHEHWAYPLIPRLVANHDLHYRKGVEKNFGLSSPLWDHVFGSYLRHVALEPDEENERQV